MNFLNDASRCLTLAGPGAALCGESAAYLHQLILDPPQPIDIQIPWPRLPPDVPGTRIRRTRGATRRALVPDPLPHTDIVDTVLDLTDRTDPETCVYWLTEATRRGLVTMEALEGALALRNRHRHRTLINDIGLDIASGATSNLEVRYVRHVERPHRLPRAQRQFIVPESGHRADFAYPGAQLLIEVDGAAFHQGAAAERDARLDAQHADAGWLTVRYRWGAVVGTPCAIAYEIARLLRSAGVDVQARPCRLETPDGD